MKTTMYISSVIGGVILCSTLAFAYVIWSTDYNRSSFTLDHDQLAAGKDLDPMQRKIDKMKTDLTRLNQKLESLSSKLERSGAARTNAVDTNSELQRQLDKIQQELASLQAHQDRADSFRAHGTHMEDTPEMPEPAMVADENTVIKDTEQMQNLFSAQEADEVWSSDSVARIDSAMQKLATEPYAQGAALVDTECKSSLCRVEVVHDSEEHFHEFELEFLHALGDSFPSTMMEMDTDENGRVRARYYLARDGYQLNGEKQKDAPPQEPPVPGTLG